MPRGKGLAPGWSSSLCLEEAAHLRAQISPSPAPSPGPRLPPRAPGRCSSGPKASEVCTQAIALVDPQPQ